MGAEKARRLTAVEIVALSVGILSLALTAAQAVVRVEPLVTVRVGWLRVVISFLLRFLPGLLAGTFLSLFALRRYWRTRFYTEYKNDVQFEAARLQEERLRADNRDSAAKTAATDALRAELMDILQQFKQTFDAQWMYSIHSVLREIESDLRSRRQPSSAIIPHYYERFVYRAQGAAERLYYFSQHLAQPGGDLAVLSRELDNILFQAADVILSLQRELQEAKVSLVGSSVNVKTGYNTLKEKHNAALHRYDAFRHSKLNAKSDLTCFLPEFAAL